MKASNALMVARGDLGVEVAAEEVPIVQKELVQQMSILNWLMVIK